MLKRTLIFILTLLCVFSYAAEALAAEIPEQYAAEASSNEVLCTGTLTFEITTPEQVFCVKGYIGCKFSAEAALVSSGNGVKVWTVLITFEKVGNSKVTFKAYSEDGERLKQFPETPVTVTVNHLPPVTDSPIILGSDRAVLLGAPPEYCGLKQKEHGFYIGTDENSLTTKVESNSIIRGKINKLVTGLEPDTIYCYRAYTITSKGTVFGNTKRFVTLPEKTLDAEDAVFPNSPARYMYLFGSTDNRYEIKKPPFGFVGGAEASKHMVTIDVPVWKIKRGKRVPGTMSVTVNYKLENNVKAIFAEIYDLDIQFPVMALKGYSYRRISGPGIPKSTPIMSHHSFGGAIDVNKPYNLFYTRKDKRNPKSPYYIPRSVIDIFEKYGWAWGGNFEEGFDTMHFQYLGLDLTEDDN